MTQLSKVYERVANNDLHCANKVLLVDICVTSHVNTLECTEGLDEQERKLSKNKIINCRQRIGL